MVIRKITRMEGAFLLQGANLTDTAVEDLLNGVQLAELIHVAEGAGKNRHMRTKAVMLLDDHLGGNLATAEGGNAAKAVEDFPRLEQAADPFDGAVGQKLEHELLSIGDGQVIQTDMDLVQVLELQDGGKDLNRLLRLEKENGLRAAVHGAIEALDLFQGLEVREHDDIRAGVEDGVDLFFRGVIVRRRIVNRVHPDEKLRGQKNLPHRFYILNGMVVLDRVHIPLALGLADIFHVDENPIDPVLLRNLRHIGAIRDVHQLESHNLNRRSFVLVVGVGEDFQNGAEEDLQIKAEAQMIHIPVVEADAFMPLDVLAPMDLGPAGDPGADIEHVELLRGILVDGPGMIGQGRARADEAHVALQDIGALGELIDGGSANDLSDLRDTGVALAAVDAGAGMLGIHDHRAELIDIEFFRLIAEAALTEDHGLARFEINRQGREQIDRGQKQHHGERDDDIEKALTKLAIHGVNLHLKEAGILAEFFLVFLGPLFVHLGGGDKLLFFHGFFGLFSALTELDLTSGTGLGDLRPVGGLQVRFRQEDAGDAVLLQEGIQGFQAIDRNAVDEEADMLLLGIHDGRDVIILAVLDGLHGEHAEGTRADDKGLALFFLPPPLLNGSKAAGEADQGHKKKLQRGANDVIGQGHATDGEFRHRDEEHTASHLDHRRDKPGEEDLIGRVAPRKLPDSAIEVEEVEDENAEDRIDRRKAKEDIQIKGELIGIAEERAHAVHRRAKDQGEEIRQVDRENIQKEDANVFFQSVHSTTLFLTHAGGVG